MTPLPCALASLDCETTGTDPATARVVEVAVVRESPDGARTVRSWRCNPGVPIPAEATAVHGITDADVAACPRFGDVATEVFDALRGAALVGYNLRAYDLPLLRAECERAGVAWPLDGAAVIDVLVLDRARTRHDLASALRRWCGLDLLDAHAAAADAEAALDVLAAMRRRADGTVAELDAESGGNAATPCGRVVWGDDGRALWGFGKVRGKPLNSDLGFARWVARDAKDMPADVRALAARGARGEDVRRAPQGA